MKQYLVRIKEIDTDEVVETMQPTSLRNANKMYGGIEINLNHDKYYVEVIPCELVEV